MKARIPGRLSARPVQQPATPALMTAEKKATLNKKKFSSSQPIAIHIERNYHHLFLAISSKSRQLDCVLQIELQMSTTRKNYEVRHHVSCQRIIHMKRLHTFAEDPASANDPFRPFFLINPEPKTQRCKKKYVNNNNA